MAILTMIYGQSGTGKSTSLRNFKDDEIAIINVSKKPLPFRNSHKTCNSDDYATIVKAIQKTDREIIIIDDATYLMVNEFMRNAKTTGFQKFTDMAFNFNNLIEEASQLADNKRVYFLGHSEQLDDGREHFKTIGKLLDEKVVLEGKFTIVLKTVVQDGKYLFATHNSGSDTVKSPFGMFKSDLIENDLKMVDDVIKEFWSIGGEHK